MGMMSEGIVLCRRRSAFRRALRRYPLILSFLVLGIMFALMLMLAPLSFGDTTGGSMNGEMRANAILHE